jgi:alpha-mannosidase
VIGCFGGACISVYENGPLQASLLVERAYGSSNWTQQITLRQGEAELLVRNWLFWNGKQQMVKLACAVPVTGPEAAHEVPFGWMNRPCDGAEVPTLMWMDISGRSIQQPGQEIGLAILNDGKYGCDVSGATARLTILRCPPYAHHFPHKLGMKMRYDWVDQGPQEFTVVLLPHVGSWRDRRVGRRAAELNLPLLPITMHGHSGDLPASHSLACLDTEEIALTALKAAEDGNGYIARFADSHGRGGKGLFQWLGQAFPLEVGPFEVVTLRLFQEEGRWKAETCDMLERPI